MNPVNISKMNTQQALSEIAKMAYGSGSLEGVKGGKGNIGLINGHVVKFNTHWKERMGSATSEMQASCNELRMHLALLANDLLRCDSGSGMSADDAKVRGETLNSILRDLGVKKDDFTVEAKGLLDRKVVARVLDQLSSVSGGVKDVWSGALESAKDLSSKGVDTHFSAVRERVLPGQRMSDINTLSGVASQLVKSSRNPVPVNADQKRMITEAMLFSYADTSGRYEFYGKAIDPSTTIKIRENNGGGSCFFYSALQQMTNAEFEDKIPLKDRLHIGGNYRDNNECVKALRKAFIAYSREIMNDIRRSALQSTTNGSESCISKVGDFYSLKMTGTVRGGKPVENFISDAVDLIEDSGFERYSVDADVMHGAFLADFLKRPVTIVSNIIRLGMKPGEQDQNAVDEFHKFCR